MGRIDEIADRYVVDYAQLDPVEATRMGITGRDGDLSDLSAEGFAARADLAARVLVDLNAVTPVDEPERVAQEAMQERLATFVDCYRAGLHTSEINVAAGPLHNLRQVFDLMPRAGEPAAATIHSRLRAVPGALAQLRRTLSDAAVAGHVSARRQLAEVARQCEAWVDPDRDDFWPGLVRRVGAAGPLPSSLLSDLERAGDAARAATAEFGRFVGGELAARGRLTEAVGREHHGLASRNFLGVEIDPEGTYAWAFAELASIDEQISATTTEIGAGLDLAGAIEKLDLDPAGRIEGRDAFRGWMQELSDRAIEDLNGRHFDIPAQVATLECCLAPVSDGAIYYTGPSEDLGRPGRMWWGVPRGVDSFSTWRETTTVYHEGVPGHHLQVGQTVVNTNTLNRWRRRMSYCSAHGEGWALYAERLMRELGYLDGPAERLGLLLSQSLRTTRVIVDIGMHLELKLPLDNPFSFHRGETWTRDLGWEFLRTHCSLGDEHLRFELNRYLGWPGQALSYKVGERVWLQARTDAQARHGARFDLRQFHRAALDLGPLGLDPLRTALARL